jgi:hypothetical protein
MKKSSRRIGLSTETLRILTPHALTPVHGGTFGNTIACPVVPIEVASDNTLCVIVRPVLGGLKP